MGQVRKNRVLIDCSMLSIGGGVQVGLAIVRNAMADRSFDWSVILSSAVAEQLGEEVEQAFEHVLRLDGMGLLGKLLVKQTLENFERKVEPDLVFHVFGPPLWQSHAPNLTGFALGKMLYPEISRQCASMEEHVRRLLLNPVKAARVRKADSIVVETATAKRRFCKTFDFPENRVAVVGNSYSPQFAEAIAQLEPRGKRLGNTFRVFVPGAGYAHKNFNFVPEVAAELREQMPDAQVRFVFTLPQKSRAWKTLCQRAEQWGVRDRIESVGTVANRDMAALYRAADAVLLPTRLEISTATYPEAFMAGVPLLTTDADFSRELCGEGALYFLDGSREHCATQLTQLLTNEALREALVAQGREVLARRYPSPEQKWLQQLASMRVALAAGRPAVHENWRLGSVFS